MASDLGVDLSAVNDLDRTFTLVSGTRAVAEAAARRLTTQRGALFYAPNYGTDIREALATRIDPARLTAWRARIEAEIRKDDRVEIVRASLSFDPAAGRLVVKVEGTTGEGPFAFTLAASALSVELVTVG